MKKNNVCKTIVILCLFLCTFTFSQQSKTEQTALIQQAEKDLSELSDIKDTPDTSLDNIASTLSVTSETLVEAIASLKTVEQSQLTITASTLDRIRQFIHQKENAEITLKKQTILLEKTLSSLQKIEQINKNVLTSKLSSSEFEKLNSLILKSTIQLSKFKQNQFDYKTQLDKAAKLLLLVEKWQSAQLTIFQTQINNKRTEQKVLNRKQDTYLKQALNFRKQLELVQSDNININQIQSLQIGLYHYEDLAWLSNVEEVLTKNAFSKKLVLASNYKLMKELPMLAIINLSNDLLEMQKNLMQINSAMDSRTLAFKNRQSIKTTNIFAEDLASEFQKSKEKISLQIKLIKPLLDSIQTLEKKKRQEYFFENDKFYTALSDKKSDFSQFATDVIASPFQVGIQFQIAINVLKESFKNSLKKKLGFLTLAVLLIVTLLSLLFRLIHSKLDTYRDQDKANLQDSSFECATADGLPDFHTKKSEYRSRFSFLKNTRFLFYVFNENWLNFGISLCLHAAIVISRVTSPSKELLHFAVIVISILVLWYSFVRLSVTTQGFSRRKAKYCFMFSFLFSCCIFVYVGVNLISDNLLVVQFYEKILFIVGIPTLYKIQQLIFFLLSKRQNEDFLYRILKWWLRLTPLVIIMCMLIGLIGYSNFAWITAERASILAIVVLIICVGFEALLDLRRWFQVLCIRHVKNGVFIAQDLVSPAMDILKILWVLGMSTTVFSLFKWNSETLVLSDINHIANYPLISLNTFDITLKNILLTAAVTYSVVRFGRWFKSISYRWLLSHLDDLSIRNSLSIFGQYLVVVTSFLIGLQLIGIDLTAFAVFAGALGVGVGLGLQNIAKNFISGILLLAERPLRTGDTVTIDTAEGIVQRIGMRSITLKTFSSEEVIVPNADVIEKPFKNWTYTDKLLRTELYLGASYDAQPERVIALLERVMAENEGIIEEPTPMAILWEYGDSAIIYRIQYHLDQSKSSTFAIRTQVLSRIWNIFKENKIEIPYPQRDVFIKN